MGGNHVTTQSASCLVRGFPSGDVRRRFYSDGKDAITGSDCGCFRNNSLLSRDIGVECRLIVKARSKLFFVSPVGAKLTALQDECPLELV